MLRRLLILFFIGFFAFGASGQSMKWRSRVKLADELFEKSQYSEAAMHYEKAWRQKPQKMHLIYKAGVSYFYTKDYVKAAKAFKNVKNERKKFPLAGLKYARCLKQSGRYDKAGQEFVYFINQYEGDDKEVLEEIVQNEIKGCDLGKTAYSPFTDDYEIFIDHLGPNVNTDKEEFNPLPFSDKVLYFSSTQAGYAEIFKTSKVNGKWTLPLSLESFPYIEKKHFCNGTLTPDLKKFYFTICKSVENWGGLTTQCEIYMIKREGRFWSEPERLRDYINDEGVTTTHPFVFFDGDKEVLLFSSNRRGGYGGMDLWYVTKDIDSDVGDFTFPENLGKEINTMGDEITPFYNADKKILFFSSNAHLTMGGFDIFMARGDLTDVKSPENMGVPFNSCADDYYFAKVPEKSSGFFTSNRKFGNKKLSTDNEDIFYYLMSKKSGNPIASGKVFDKKSGQEVNNFNVSLFEISNLEGKKIISRDTFNNGVYSLNLKPDKSYLVKIQKEGYIPFSYDIEVDAKRLESNYGKSVYLMKFEKHFPKNYTSANSGNKKAKENNKVPKKKKESPTSVKKETDSKKTTTKATEIGTSGISYTTTDSDSYKIVTSAPRYTGEYYKIQLIAIAKFNPKQKRYKPLIGLGKLQTEYILKRKLYRVLLGNHFSYNEAKSVLTKVKKKGFSNAYLVKYEEGKRMGRFD